MSAILGGQPLVVHQDDAENTAAVMAVDGAPRRSKRVHEEGGGSKKRAALGTITNYFRSGLAPRAGKKGDATDTASVESQHTAPSDAAAAAAAAAGIAGDENLAPAPMLQEQGPQLGEQVDIKDYVDIDINAADPLHVQEYMVDIFDHLFAQEQKFRPRLGYMSRQRQIDHHMRHILVDWLVRVALEYRLHAHTLHLTVAYIDRFLSEMDVTRSKLQLVGVTCMLLASKYEEVYPPSVADFEYITDSTYTTDQIFKMEYIVLKVLRFNMSGITSLSFLERFLKAAGADLRVKHLSLYLCELTLQNADQFLKYLPSVVAAGAVCLAQHTYGQQPWTRTMEHYTRQTAESITPVVNDLHRVMCEANTWNEVASKEKFASEKFHNVSSIVPPREPPKF